MTAGERSSELDRCRRSIWTSTPGRGRPTVWSASSSWASNAVAGAHAAGLGGRVADRVRGAEPAAGLGDELRAATAATHDDRLHRRDVVAVEVGHAQQQRDLGRDAADRRHPVRVATSRACRRRAIAPAARGACSRVGGTTGASCMNPMWANCVEASIGLPPSHWSGPRRRWRDGVICRLREHRALRLAGGAGGEHDAATRSPSGASGAGDSPTERSERGHVVVRARGRARAGPGRAGCSFGAMRGVDAGGDSAELGERRGSRRRTRVRRQRSARRRASGAVPARQPATATASGRDRARRR